MSDHYAINARGANARLNDAYHAIDEAAAALDALKDAQRQGQLDPASGINVTILMTVTDLLHSVLTLLCTQIAHDWLPDPDYR